MRATKVALTLLRKWEVGPTLFMKAMYLADRKIISLKKKFFSDPAQKFLRNTFSRFTLVTGIKI